MDLTKRLGISDDFLKTATEVLEGKKISHPNQKEISAAAPPEDEITAADFKALKAKKKMHRVEGFDRNKKRYESPLFETYEEALDFFNKIRKSAPLTNLEIVELGESVEQVEEAMKPYVSYTAARPGRSASATVMGADGKPHKTFSKDDHGHDYKEQAMGYFKAMTAKRSKMEESKELNTANATDARAHDCAKHVVHEQWGVGETVPTMHAEPDTAGNIAWYDVMFEHGIEHQVPTLALEITLSETHVHKKSKRMDEQEQHGKKKTKKGESQVEFNPEIKKEEFEIGDEVELLPEGYKMGDYVNVTNPNASPRYKILGKTKTHYTLQMNPEGTKTAEFPKERIARINKQAWNTAKGDPAAYAKRVAQTKGGLGVKEEIEQIDEKMSEFEKLAARRAWQKNPANKGKPLPTHLQTDQQKQKAAAKSADMKMMTKEEVDTLDEGRKAGVVGSVLSNPAAREHFKKLTGKEPSYFHISKNPEHAQAALAHAAKAKAPEGENPAEAGDEDTEANKHPINQLRGIADRGKGRFMGKDITRAHANKLISMHDDLKPAQKLDFVSNIGKHLSKVMS